jgi:hypothetical protein
VANNTPATPMFGTGDNKLQVGPGLHGSFRSQRLVSLSIETAGPHDAIVDWYCRNLGAFKEYFSGSNSDLLLGD